MAATAYWHRFQRQRISRRRMLRSAVASAAGLAVVAASSATGVQLGRGARSAVAGESRYGGVLRLANTVDWGTIDPVTSLAAGPSLFPRIYNALLDRSRRQPDFFFMDLAESFEQPDDETYIFLIRSGVKIAPNDLGIPERPMDAFDAQSWMERIGADTGAFARSFTEPWVASFEAVDARTFQMQTNGPYAYTLFRIGTPLGGTIPPREFFERGISLRNQGVGAGPWVLRPNTYHEDGRAIVGRNVNYYRTDPNTGEQLPYIDSIRWTQIKDRATRRAAFLSEQIHQYSAEDRDEMEEIRGQVVDVVVVEDPIDTYISFTMNPTRPPWDDERIRKAANLALNRQEYVDRIVGADGGRPNGLVHWPLGDFALPPEELELLQPFDPELSRQLIQDAGFDVPLRVKVMHPGTSIEFHDQHLPIFIQQMAAAGFEIDQEQLDFATWLKRYQNVEYDASLALNQIYETPEIPLDWHHSGGPQGDQNFAIGIGVLFPEVDEAIENSKRVTNPEEQVEAIRDVQRLIYEKGPAFLPIMSWITFTLRHAFVKNVADGLGRTGLYLTSEWWLGPDAPDPGPVGDVSCDGSVNSIDAALVLQRDAGLTPVLPCDENADVNRDGRINAIDAALILQHSAGLLPNLPP